MINKIARYDFCVDDLGNESFRPCPDGRYVLYEEVVQYLEEEEPDTDYDFLDDTPIPNRKELEELKKQREKEDEKYIYLPMLKGLRTRFHKEEEFFEQTNEYDYFLGGYGAKFYKVKSTKPLLEMLIEYRKKENKNA